MIMKKIMFYGLILFILSNCDSTAPKPPKPLVKVGEVLKTQYFDVTINKTALKPIIHFNEYSNYKAGEGNIYLIMNITIKNTDTESRTMFSDGTIFIKTVDKEYKFETSETIIEDGWGFILEDINPLVTKTTNIVFKIPNNLEGDVSFQPGRSEDDEKIYIGKIEFKPKQ